MILVTGGAGVMGSRLVHGLVEKGESVRVLTLPNDPFVSRLDGLDCDIRYGDISDASTLKDLFDDIKTIYHLAAILINPNPDVFQRVNVGGTKNMVAGGIDADAEHFIFVSSISVIYPYTTPYSLSKRECERMVKEQGKMKWTIIRPTLAYNEHGGEEFMMFMNYLMKYPIVPFIGAGRAKKNPVYVDDLIRGFLAIPGNPKAYGKTYNLCGSEAISMRDFAHLILKHQGVTKRFVTIPLPVCKFLAWVMQKTMKRPPLTWNAIAGVCQDANPDWAEASADLGYNPIPVRQGFEKCFPI